MTDQSTPRFAINKSVSIGDIAVCITLLAAGFMSFSSVDKRVTLTEQAQIRLEKDVMSNALENKVDQKELQKGLGDLKTEVMRLTYIVERTASPIQQRKPNGPN